MLRAALFVSAILSLAACDSPINPLNLFGADREERIIRDPETNEVIDGRILISDVTHLSVELTTAGAIVRATGVMPSQGFFDAELVPVETTDGLFAYEFRVAQPGGTATPGVQQIDVAAELSADELNDIGTIAVIGQNNRRSVGRR